MTILARRDLLAVLAAAVALPSAVRPADALAAASPLDAIDRAAARRIGQAWLAARPTATAKALAARLFPHGRGADALPALRRQAARDFRSGAVFVHRGWRLSDTEGALFALLALETRERP